jgi:hypothetical protein
MSSDAWLALSPQWHIQYCEVQLWSLTQCPASQMSPYALYSATTMGPGGKVVHYVGNRVPFGMHGVPQQYKPLALGQFNGVAIENV